MSTEVTKNHLVNVVAKSLWGVCIFEVARSGRAQRRDYSACGFMTRL